MPRLGQAKGGSRAWPIPCRREAARNSWRVLSRGLFCLSRLGGRTLSLKGRASLDAVGGQNPPRGGGRVRRGAGPAVAAALSRCGRRFLVLLFFGGTAAAGFFPWGRSFLRAAALAGRRPSAARWPLRVCRAGASAAAAVRALGGLGSSPAAPPTSARAICRRAHLFAYCPARLRSRAMRSRAGRSVLHRSLWRGSPSFVMAAARLLFSGARCDPRHACLRRFPRLVQLRQLGASHTVLSRTRGESAPCPTHSHAALVLFDWDAWRHPGSICRSVILGRMDRRFIPEAEPAAILPKIPHRQITLNCRVAQIGFSLQEKGQYRKGVIRHCTACRVNVQCFGSPDNAAFCLPSFPGLHSEVGSSLPAKDVRNT